MFDGLTNKLSGIFSKLGSRGILTEKDIEDGLREIRLALLEADVSLPVVKEFMSKVKEKALGEKVIKSIRPDQQLVKIVYDELDGDYTYTYKFLPCGTEAGDVVNKVDNPKTGDKTLIYAVVLFGSTCGIALARKYKKRLG